MSDPTLSDIDFKNKMAWVWTTLKHHIDTILSDIHSSHFLCISFLSFFAQKFGFTRKFQEIEHLKMIELSVKLDDFTICIKSGKLPISILHQDT